MPIIVDPTQFNPAALTVPAVYLIVEPPQASVTGAPASVSGMVGTASWGPLNKPILIGDMAGVNTQIGPVSTAALTDIHDLATDVWQALQQSSQLGLSVQAVRVSDGTDAAASLALVDNAANRQTITVGGSKTTSDTLQLTFTNVAITGNPVVLNYTVLSGDTLSTIATAFKVAINANANLAASGITATSSGPVITVNENSLDIIPVITNTSSGSPTETMVVVAPSAVAGGTLNALYSGVQGNKIKLSIIPGTSASLVNVLLTAWAGKAQEFYMGLPNSSAFWAALQTALAGGTGPTQGASQLARFTPAGSGNPQAPQLLNSAVLAGGLDGRSGVTTSNLVGSPTGGSGGQGSGLYALLKCKPVIQQAWCVGLTDSTAFPTIQTFGAQNGVLMIVAQPIGTSVSTAVATNSNVGVDNYQVVSIIDWCKVFDPINNVARYVSPTGIAGGAISALSPEQSPLNKPLQGVLTTYREETVGPYSNADIGLANTSGLTLIDNPIPAGPRYGFITAVNTSLNNIGTAPIEYSRMTNFLMQSIGANLGQFIGKLQSAQPVDPLRSSVKAVLNSFLAQLESNVQLDAHQVFCEFSLTNNSPGYNTPTTIGNYILSVFVAARYLSSVWYLVFTLQGGTTVQVQNIISPQPTA